MSKIALSPNASGTGTFTIASPNSNTSRTLTLPDVTGSLVTADQIVPGNATATAGAVGSYALLYSASSLAANATVAGSNLQYAGALGAFGAYHRWEDFGIFSAVGEIQTSPGTYLSSFVTTIATGASPSGTWRCMGAISPVARHSTTGSTPPIAYGVSLFVRIS